MREARILLVRRAATAGATTRSLLARGSDRRGTDPGAPRTAKPSHRGRGRPASGRDIASRVLARAYRGPMFFRRRVRPPKRYGRPQSVAECLKIVEAIDDEARATGRHLDTKTGPIAGFAAVTLTLNSTLGAPLLKDKLEAPWEAIAHASFFLSVAALLIAAAAAVVGGLAPKQQDDVTPEFVRELAQRPAMTTDPEELRERWLVTLADIAVSDRLANRTRVRAMRVAVVALGVGLIGVAGQALTLGVTA